MRARSFMGRGGALALITAVELLVFLDTSVVNIALPQIGAGLHLREAGLSWVTNAYLLAFGGCMLVGGRAADHFGARRMFQIGLALFTLASAAAGLAVAPWHLIAARALQGIGGAVLIPAQLSLLTQTFTEPDARRRAFGVWSAMGAAGAAIGTSAGGLLTQTLGWPAIFLINVPIGAVVLIVSPRLLAADPVRTRGATARLDLPGAVVGTAGLLTLGYAVGALADPGTRVVAAGLSAVAVVLLVVFAVIESRTQEPLVPLRLFGVREVTGSTLVNALVGAAHVPAFALLALYLQQTQHYGPNRSGLAVLPVAAAALVTSRTVIPGLLERLGARQVLAIGLALQAAGLAWFAMLPPRVDYLSDVLPAALLLGVGLPAAFVGVTAPAVTAVASADAGVTAGVVSTAQRIGSGLGVTAVLVLAAAVTGDETTATSPAYLAGLRAGFAACAALALLGLLLTLILLRPDPSKAAVTPAVAKGHH
ncbi:MFS transporter [Catellatospora sp. TT07R-123]|uniref:MFS transporter n=1 Tax=Catellatospora sp. TT07R-123 TaxID=2733863 RepID=UPI001B27A15C|nr:MFS transporter [Catellatospora sp. TT07R-123]GHJ49011.1 MFS transporter [Catellatospora sp. TT07R-123]